MNFCNEEYEKSTKMFVNIKKLMHPLLCKRRGGNLGSMGRGLGLGYGLIPFYLLRLREKILN